MASIQSAQIHATSVESAGEREGQFTLFQILGLWGASALLMAFLAWVVVPAVVYRTGLPAILTYWLILMAGMACQTGMSLWLISRRAGNLRWGTIWRYTRLNQPQDPKTGQPRLRLLWRAVPIWMALMIPLIVSVLLPVLVTLLRKSRIELFNAPIFHWPAYANITELASPEFASQWWLVIAALLGWVWSTLLAEELFFRGVLLPRMRAAFGKGDWAINALLYGLYNPFQYWMIPFRLLEGMIIARSARRFSSTWMAFAMRGVEGLALLALVGVGVSSPSLATSPIPAQFPTINRQPASTAIYRGPLAALPAYNPTSGATLQVDLRGADLSSLDLKGSQGANLPYADFDLQTVWPTVEQLPEGFIPTQILELGKNPGLGVRSLHARGITGRGVGVAIIDQVLLADHEEYAGRLRWYEEIPGTFEIEAQMHGPAVASLAVGRTVGVAPEADLYYLSVGNRLSTIMLYSHEYADAIRRILQINDQLPAGRKIRVISVSSDWIPSLSGYQDVLLAVRQAEAAGMLVVRVSRGTGLPATVGLGGLGRSFAADPEAFGSYEPGIFWAAGFYQGGSPGNRLLVPMDSRTLAGTAGPHDFWFNRVGGGSWVPPYVAGLYALAVQVDPGITPASFWSAAQQTARTVEVVHDGRTFTLSAIIDPVALINALQGK